MEIASYLYACSMETYDEYKPRKAKVKFAGIKYDFERVVLTCLVDYITSMIRHLLESSGNQVSDGFLYDVGGKVVEYSRLRLETCQNNMYRTNFSTLIDDETREVFLNDFLQQMCVDPVEPNHLVNYEYALTSAIKEELEEKLVHDFMAGTKNMFARFSEW